MIQVFLCQETKFNKPAYNYKYIYLYDPDISTVWIVNPHTGLEKTTNNGFLTELYYKDNTRERIHSNLIDWEE